MIDVCLGSSRFFFFFGGTLNDWSAAKLKVFKAISMEIMRIEGNEINEAADSCHWVLVSLLKREFWKLMFKNFEKLEKHLKIFKVQILKVSVLSLCYQDVKIFLYFFHAVKIFLCFCIISRILSFPADFVISRSRTFLCKFINQKFYA